MGDVERDLGRDSGGPAGYLLSSASPMEPLSGVSTKGFDQAQGDFYDYLRRFVAMGAAVKVAADKVRHMSQTSDERVRGLEQALTEARLQLEYLDSRWPTGTTPAMIAKINHALASAEGAAA